MSAGHPTLLGLDFSCAPTRRKPLTLAQGVRAGHAVKLLGLEALTSLDEWAARLRPAGMARAMLATAVAQAAASVVALFADGVSVFVLTAVFALLWLVSAALFHRAAKQTAMNGATR